MIKEGKKKAKSDTYLEFGKSDNGSEFCVLTFTILEGPDAGDFIRWTGFFTEKTIERTMQSLRYCGWSNNDITNPEGLGSNVVEIVVEHEEYKGKLYPKVKWVNKLSGGIPAKNQMDDAAKMAFAKRMKAHAMAVPATLADQGTKYDPSQYSGSQMAATGTDDGAPPHSDSDNGGGWEDDQIPFAPAEKWAW